MRKFIIILIGFVIVVFVGIQLAATQKEAALSVVVPEDVNTQVEVSADEFAIDPISHATFVLTWHDTVVYNDPIGGAVAFVDKPVPDLILISDIHGDHLHIETLEAVVTANTVIVAPEEVVNQLPESLLSNTVMLRNGEKTTQKAISIEAIPMYNLPENEESRHTKGRGNGYVLERGNMRIYIAGDTEDIPEMRALTDIDIAFVPMNLPFTMDVESAADGVLAFAPRQVYPYHYRGQDGLSDVEQFKTLVNAENPDIEVILANWYPE